MNTKHAGKIKMKKRKKKNWDELMPSARQPNRKQILLNWKWAHENEENKRRTHTHNVKFFDFAINYKSETEV